MTVIRKDLGIVTAYAYAVSKGYTGTEAEFAELMASYADVAEEAAQSASDAENAAARAEQAADSIVVDTALSDTSTNPVQNKVITGEVAQLNNAMADIGSVAVQNIAPAYDATKTYAEGDVVSYNGMVYKCTTAVNPAEAFDPGKWTKTDVVGMVSGGSSLKNIKDEESGGTAEGFIDASKVSEITPPPGTQYNTATGKFAHVEGGDYYYEPATEEDEEIFDTYPNEASGVASHAEGRKCKASGDFSHAEGWGCEALTFCSHAEGSDCVAKEVSSHAEGRNTEANGTASHAEGADCKAIGDFSHAEGYGTVAIGKSQHVFGEYNVEDETGGYVERGAFVEIVGNGTRANSRSNARTLDWGGNESLAGGLTLGKGTADETTITAAQLKALIALLNA